MAYLVTFKPIVILLVASLPAIACADIYMQQDDTEEIYLTNLVDITLQDTNSAQTGKAGSHKQFKVLVTDQKMVLAPTALPKIAEQALPFSQAVRLAAADTSLEPELLHAVMTVESNNNPQAVSVRGARGLMQLMPAISKRYAVSNPHNPSQNIAAGARYLQVLQSMFHGDTRLAVAAYNAGPSAVIKSGFKIPEFSETQHYVSKVMYLYQKLSEIAYAKQQLTELSSNQKIGR